MNTCMYTWHMTIDTCSFLQLLSCFQQPEFKSEVPPRYVGKGIPDEVLSLQQGRKVL